MIISKLHKKILKWIFSRAVKQGINHEHNIILCYGRLIRAARKEFREDNKLTLNEFLRECHEKALERF